VQHPGGVTPAEHPRPDPGITGQHLHAVARMTGECGEQQRRVHGRVEARGVTDPTCARA